MLKSAKKSSEAFKSKLHLQIATVSRQVKTKTNFLNEQLNQLKGKFAQKNAATFQHTFDQVISAIVYIQAGKELERQLNSIYTSDLTKLFQKCELTSQEQIALEHIYAYAQANRIKEFQGDMEPVMKCHQPTTDIVCSHETHVFLNNQQINDNDIVKYYPQVAQSCEFNDPQFLKVALKKYSAILDQLIDDQPQVQQTTVQPTQSDLVHQQFMQQQYWLYQQQHQNAGMPQYYQQQNQNAGMPQYYQQPPGQIPQQFQYPPNQFYQNMPPQYQQAPVQVQNTQPAQPVPSYQPQNQVAATDDNPYQMPFEPPPIPDVTPEQLEQLKQNVNYPEVPEFKD